MILRLHVLLASLALLACAGCPASGTADAGLDAAGMDAGLDDAGLDDAGLDDVGLDDAGLDDGGSTVDASEPPDASDVGPDACPVPTTLCGAGCFDLAADPEHCGVCERVCTALPGSVPFCSMGRCVMGLCRPGFGSCDGDRTNGCEVDLDTSVLHCGRCERACPEGPHATPRCALGVCSLVCDEGFVDCDASAGCECPS